MGGLQGFEENKGAMMKKAKGLKQLMMLKIWIWEQKSEILLVASAFPWWNHRYLLLSDGLFSAEPKEGCRIGALCVFC